MNKKLLLTGAILLFSFCFMGVAFGQSGDWETSPIDSPQQVVDAIRTVMNWAWTIITIVVVIFLIYAGFLFVTAAGNDEQVSRAKTMIKYALIGIVVMILAGGIMGIMEGLLRGQV